ncbi:MAG: hypothetical protein HY431_02420 [Candidatus Levybacteria bacterium]|nr:hypothetical protein [Candidatus Levybacteria bacterium]
MSNVGKEGGMTSQVETQQLPETELQKNAFELINSFRGALRKARDFQGAAAATYIGELDYGYRVDPNSSRRVGVWRGKVFWGIHYSFTDDTHELSIERETRISEAERMHESIFLKSKRFEDLFGGRQIPHVPTRIHYVNLSSFQGDNPQGLVENNTPAALEKAQDFLKSFAPTR